MKRGPPRSAGVRWGPFSLKSLFFSVFGFRSGPDGSAQAVGFIWSLFPAKRSILDLIRTIFNDLGLNRHCGPDLDLQHQAGDGPWSGLEVGPRLSQAFLC